MQRQCQAQACVMILKIEKGLQQVMFYVERMIHTATRSFVETAMLSACIEIKGHGMHHSLNDPNWA